MMGEQRVEVPPGRHRVEEGFSVVFLGPMVPCQQSSEIHYDPWRWVRMRMRMMMRMMRMMRMMMDGVHTWDDAEPFPAQPDVGVGAE